MNIIFGYVKGSRYALLMQNVLLIKTDEPSFVELKVKTKYNPIKLCNGALVKEMTYTFVNKEKLHFVAEHFNNEFRYKVNENLLFTSNHVETCVLTYKNMDVKIEEWTTGS